MTTINKTIRKDFTKKPFSQFYAFLHDKDGFIKNLILAFAAILPLIGCAGDDKVENDCPEVTLPVIIPAVIVKLFDTNQTPLNVCGAIVTVESANGVETIYGSAFNNCSTKFSIAVGYNLIEHKLLIEKAGYVNQNFDSVFPLATRCGYEPSELSVNLVAD